MSSVAYKMLCPTGVRMAYSLFDLILGLTETVLKNKKAGKLAHAMWRKVILFTMRVLHNQLTQPPLFIKAGKMTSHVGFSCFLPKKMVRETRAIFFKSQKSQQSDFLLCCAKASTLLRRALNCDVNATIRLQTCNDRFRCRASTCHCRLA
jgi:hypothetical protein